MTLRDRLDAARHAHFVGRQGELEQFRRLITDVDTGAQVLFVYGPGGVGKTTLLHEFAFICGAEGVPVGRLDARTVEATPEALGAALDVEAPARGGTSPGAAARRVLLVDTLEVICNLDDWLRDVLFPTLGEGVVLVLAGRRLPTGPWQTDPGWAELVQVMPLRNFSPPESQALLDDRGLPDTQREPVLAFARGYPLALALAAETVRENPDAPFDLTSSPQAVEPLLNRFLSEITEPGVREIVRACSLVRVATESLLEDLLGRPVPSDQFDRVRHLPIVEDTVSGIALHDLALDVIAADLRWRAPDRYAHLHEQARGVYTDRLRVAQTPEAQREVLADYAFLYRDAPIAGALIGRLREAMRGGGALSLRPAELRDHAGIVEMTGRHEGTEAAAIVEHWLGRQPDRFVCVCDADGAPAGFMASLALDAASPTDLERDPVAAATARALRRAAPREGQRALLFRFWMDREHHQDVSPVQALLFARTVWDYLTTPDLAVSTLMCVAPHGWAPILGFAGLARQPEADAEVGGVRYEAFTHDWRVQPPDAWLASLADRTPLAIVNPVTPLPPPPLVVLSEADFGDAAREAVKGLVQPALLLESDLLHSRLVGDRVDADADAAHRAEALDALVREAIQSVGAVRNGDRYLAALETMFIRPAPSQAIAAERLDVPFSTFRRHLARGVDLVAEALWQLETR